MMSLIRDKFELCFSVHFQADLHAVAFRELAAFAKCRADLLGRSLAIFSFDETVGTNFHSAAAAVMGQDDELFGEFDVLFDDGRIGTVELARRAESDQLDPRISKLFLHVGPLLLY